MVCTFAKLLVNFGRGFESKRFEVAFWVPVESTSMRYSKEALISAKCSNNRINSLEGVGSLMASNDTRSEL